MGTGRACNRRARCRGGQERAGTCDRASWWRRRSGLTAAVIPPRKYTRPEARFISPPADRSAHAQRVQCESSTVVWSNNCARACDRSWPSQSRALESARERPQRPSRRAARRHSPTVPQGFRKTQIEQAPRPARVALLAASLSAGLAYPCSSASVEHALRYLHAPPLGPLRAVTCKRQHTGSYSCDEHQKLRGSSRRIDPRACAW